MAKGSKEIRARAQMQFDRKIRASSGVVAEREAEFRATRAKTERLKALRLAKEAADKEVADKKPEL